MELKTNVPAGMICKACTLYKYHVEHLDKEQHLFKPIRLNDIYKASEALVLVIAAPYLEIHERMAELKKLFARNYYGWETIQVYVIFGVACNYPQNETLKVTSKKACSKNFKRMLDLCVLSHSTAKIFAFGSGAIECLKIQGFTFADGKTTSISTNRLIRHSKNPYGVPVFCTMNFDRYTLGSSQEKVIASDLEFMQKMTDGTYEYKKLNYSIVKSLGELKSIQQKIEEAKRLNGGKVLMSFDTETTSLSIFGRKKRIRLLTYQISFEVGVGYTIPLEHKEQTDEIFSGHCNKFLQYVLGDPDIIKIMHNAMYDYRVCFRLGFKINSFVWDTLAMHHLVYSEPPHDLKYLTRKYLDYGNYDEALDKYLEAHPEANPRNGGNYGEIPLDILGTYGAYDAAATLELFHLLYAELQDLGLLEFYQKQTYPAHIALLQMSCTGMRIDYKELERYYVEYASAMRDYYEQNICTLPQVKEWEMSREENKLYAEYEKDPALYMVKYNKRSAPVKLQFNPKSTQHLAELLTTFCKIPVIETTPKGAPSFSKDVRALLKTVDPKNNPYNVDLTVIHLLDTYLLQMHEYANFVKGIYESDMVDEHSRIHSSFNIASAVTGRLSSSDPNMQQLPSKEARLEGYKIKSLFRPAPGKVIVQGDYSQAELRVIASVANDEKMLNAFASGADIHIATAAMVFGIPLEDVTKEQRKAAKAINFGLIYGLGLEAFAVEFYNALGGNVEKAGELYMNLVKQGYSGTYNPAKKGKKK